VQITKYSDQHDHMSVSLLILKQQSKFTKFSMHVAYCRGLTTMQYVMHFWFCEWYHVFT